MDFREVADVDVIAADPLGCPFNAYMGLTRPCECPEYAMHSDNCSWTPIFAQLRTEMELPNPWTDWPMPAFYISLDPDENHRYIQRFVLGAYTDLEKFDTFDPRWSVTQGSTWTLPDYSFGGDDEPPWITRQENPEL